MVKGEADEGGPVGKGLSVTTLFLGERSCSSPPQLNGFLSPGHSLDFPRAMYSTGGSQPEAPHFFLSRRCHLVGRKKA